MINKFYNHSFRLKTEKAIESVNHYELMKEDFRFKIQSIQDHLKRHHFKMLNEGTWAKMQLISASSQLYELVYEQKKSHQSVEAHELILKIVIKNFTGKVLHLSLSPKPQIVKLALCEYKISDQRIIKVRNPILNDRRTYLTLHSPGDLIVFKMKYQFVVEEEAGVRQRMKSSSLQLLKIKSSRYVSSERLREGEQKEEIIIRLKKGRNGNASPRSLLDRSRTSSARAENFVKQKERIVLAKQKRNDLQVYRQKSKSLRILSHQCTDILKEYQTFLAEENLKKRQLLKNLVIFLQTTIFLKNTQQITMERQQGITKVKNTKTHVKNCIKKFISLTATLKEIQPNRSRRELLAVYYHSAQIAKTLLKEDCSKAKHILKTCLDLTYVGMSINQAFQQSAAYRTKVRVIQRFWKSRNTAQISLFKEYILKQLSELLSKHLYFGLVRQQFFKREMPEHLAWQYLTESSLKIKKIVAAYYAKLRQIEEIKKINNEIKQFNSKALKKHQKPLLQVPPKPCYPVCRYFRDLNILKAMLRSWLEIEYRRHVRKLKKEGKSLPKGMKNV